MGAVLWLIVYGSGIVLSLLLHDSDPSPRWLMKNLPNVLHGDFSWHVVGRYASWSRSVTDAASQAGVTGTPTVLVNGKEIDHTVEFCLAAVTRACECRRRPHGDSTRSIRPRLR